MDVVPLREAATEPAPSDFMPAIRTPEQFRAAVDRIGEILVNIAAGDQADAEDALAEAQNLREACRASPFMNLGGEVVARGFQPRVLSRAD